MSAGLHRPVRLGGIAAIVVVAAAAGGCRRGPAVAPQVNQQDLHAALVSVLGDKAVPRFVVHNRAGRGLWTATRQFYQKRDFAPVWLDHGRLRHGSADLIEALGHADADAIDPARYDASGVERIRDEMTRSDAHRSDERAEAEFDARLTYLYLQYAADLVNGVTPAPPRLKRPADAFDAAASLEEAVAHDSVRATLSALQQRDPEYAALRNALASYRTFAANGGWPELPSKFRLKPGERSPLAAVLAKRLAITGDYSAAGPAAPSTYDGALQSAVKRFQERHGLTPDGVVGPRLVAELNVPAAARVRQLALNMERWRWLPRDPGERSIFVNIPEYRLEVRDHGHVPVSMRVVVGKKDSQTPSFTGDMSYIVLAPFWNVPADIAEKETLPSVQRDPAFLRRTNMEIVDRRGHTVDPDDVDLSNTARYRFRQRPGASNSLGLVKFMFPNPYNVYLHDTPADALFSRESRAFSHGCVRVEEPEKLAEYVLSDQPEWTGDRIREAMHSSEQRHVALREKIPVYLAYLTARASANGEVFFFRDVYGRDSR